MKQNAYLFIELTNVSRNINTLHNFCEVIILLHTFENYAFGASEIDTPIEDPKLDGHFVKIIRGSDRESSIWGAQKSWGAA